MKKFFYRADKGDTLRSVSERFQIPAVKIIKDNNLSGEIEEGDMLYLEKEESWKIYTVSPTDTAESIAEKFHTTAAKILEDNNLPYVYFSQQIIVR